MPNHRSFFTMSAMPKKNKKVQQSAAIDVVQNAIAPSRVVRGEQALAASGHLLKEFGTRPFLIGGDRSLGLFQSRFADFFEEQSLRAESYGIDCSEKRLKALLHDLKSHEADFVMGLGGGKALDAASWLPSRPNFRLSQFPLRRRPVPLGRPYPMFIQKPVLFSMM